MSIATLKAGEALPSARFTLTAEAVAAYRDAVGDEAPLYREEPSLVPPTALAALAVKHLLEALELPPGTVHAAQELTFQRSTMAGQELVCRAHIDQSGERRGWHFVTVDFQIEDAAGQTAVAGRSNLLIPAE